jgi:alkanesulfonate monooxygenase SsuD/methylene tetrahydromethanopterin reductase-like flavin-dependent oxidoreductase (luciferase family)
MTDGMRAGVYIANYGEYADPGFTLEVADAAQRAGWHGVFMYDHLVIGEGPSIDPWTTLAGIASRCSGMVLGVMVAVPGRRDLGVLAQQTSTLQRLSDERGIVGLGLGVDDDFHAFGKHVSLGERVAWVELALELLPRFRRGDVVTGRFDAQAGKNQRATAEIRLDPARTGPELGRLPELWGRAQEPSGNEAFSERRWDLSDPQALGSRCAPQARRDETAGWVGASCARQQAA